MPKHLLLGLLTAFILSGCSRKEVATPPIAPAPTAAVSVDASAADAAPPPPAQPAAAAASPAQPNDDSVGADLGNTYVTDLQSIVDSYIAVTKRKPTDFNQLISAGYLATMPPAPAGKKYAIEPATMKVKLVNH